MSNYYYAPAVTDESGSISPIGEIPPQTRALKYDSSLNRFILIAFPESVPAEWSQVDSALIELDYPGLLGGA